MLLVFVNIKNWNAAGADVWGQTQALSLRFQYRKRVILNGTFVLWGHLNLGLFVHCGYGVSRRSGRRSRASGIDEAQRSEVRSRRTLLNLASLAEEGRSYSGTQRKGTPLHES